MSSTWRLPLRDIALSPGELPALWHHHLLVQSQDRGRAGAVRTIKSESLPAPPVTSGPVAGDMKPLQGQRYSGEPLAQATGWREEVKPHLPTRAMLPGNHRMDRKSFPEPGSISHTETLNSCGHTSSVCGDAAGKLSHSQPQAELEAYSIWRQKGRRPQATVGEGERGEGGGKREEGGTQALRHPVRGSPPRKQHSLPWLTQEKFFFSRQITINRTGNIHATFKPGKSIIFVQ